MLKKKPPAKSDQYYTATKDPSIREFPPFYYLALKGVGAPAGLDYVKGIQALYSLAYSIKKICKKGQRDFNIPKLESLWWVDSDISPLDTPRDAWNWKILLRIPEYVTPEIAQEAKLDLMKKKKELNLIKEAGLEKIYEGRCIQVLHTGPYETESATIEKIKENIKENNWTENGYHHEIYLSDPRKTAPEKLKTILRQPIRNLSDSKQN